MLNGGMRAKTCKPIHALASSRKQRRPAHRACLVDERRSLVTLTPTLRPLPETPALRCSGALSRSHTPDEPPLQIAGAALGCVQPGQLQRPLAPELQLYGASAPHSRRTAEPAAPGPRRAARNLCPGSPRRRTAMFPSVFERFVPIDHILRTVKIDATHAQSAHRPGVPVGLRPDTLRSRSM